jgi:hypothetical protein
MPPGTFERWAAFFMMCENGGPTLKKQSHTCGRNVQGMLRPGWESG